MENLQIAGVPVNKIIDFIVANNSFKREEVMEELEITKRDVYSDIVRILDEKNILVKWVNNSRVGNYDLTYWQMLLLLKEATIQETREILEKPKETFEKVFLKFEEQEIPQHIIEDENTIDLRY